MGICFGIIFEYKPNGGGSDFPIRIFVLRQTYRYHFLGCGPKFLSLQPEAERDRISVGLRSRIVRTPRSVNFGEDNAKGCWWCPSDSSAHRSACIGSRWRSCALLLQRQIRGRSDCVGGFHSCIHFPATSLSIGRVGSSRVVSQQRAGSCLSEWGRYCHDRGSSGWIIAEKRFDIDPSFANRPMFPALPISDRSGMHPELLSDCFLGHLKLQTS